MVYRMRLKVDGGCRGQPGSIAAAAAVRYFRYGRPRIIKQLLPSSPPPTSQRAEFIAIIIGQQQALARYEKLHSNPKLSVKIYSDSKNVVACMTEWLETWRGNGWRNSVGKKIADLDLILEADRLNDELRGLGKLEYVWIPRNENKDADRACREAMDRAILNACH